MTPSPLPTPFGDVSLPEPERLRRVGKRPTRRWPSFTKLAGIVEVLASLLDVDGAYIDVVHLPRNGSLARALLRPDGLVDVTREEEVSSPARVMDVPSTTA